MPGCHKWLTRYSVPSRQKKKTTNNKKYSVMEQKDIDIYEILKGMPDGTPLYTPMCGNVEFTSVEADKEKSRAIWTENENGAYSFDKHGKWMKGGEALLFPSKEMRDWSKFAWKKGDVLVNNDNDVYIIFEKFEDDAYTRFKGKHYLWKQIDNVDYSKEESQMVTSLFEKVNDYEAQTYISTIEEQLGGKLNRETLEIEKQPEFKDGDIVTITFNWGEDIVYIFKSEDSNSYSYYAWLNGSIPTIIESSHPKSDIYTVRLSTEQEKKKLFDALAKENKAWDSERKQIVDLKPKVELKPFDKVLVRNEERSKWQPAFFVRDLGDEVIFRFKVLPIQSGRVATVSQCIPFEGNENIAFTNYDEDLPF